MMMQNIDKETLVNKYVANIIFKELKRFQPVKKMLENALKKENNDTK